MSAGEGPRPVGTFWMMDLERQAPNIVAPRVPATFERAGPELAGALAEAAGFAVLTPFGHERFDGSRRCYVARVDGALAAYGWASFREEDISEIGLRFRLAPGDAYLWDFATLPAYRGQRLYPALLSHILRDLRAEGLRRAWIGANTESVESQKGIILAGFEPVADVFPPPPANPHAVAGVPSISARPGVPPDLMDYLRAALFSEG
jgi:ribosomal protein S18 acetylase RimI-like enzyme